MKKYLLIPIFLSSASSFGICLTPAQVHEINNNPCWNEDSKSCIQFKIKEKEKQKKKKTKEIERIKNGSLKKYINQLTDTIMFDHGFRAPEDVAQNISDYMEKEKYKEWNDFEESCDGNECVPWQDDSGEAKKMFRNKGQVNGDKFCDEYHNKQEENRKSLNKKCKAIIKKLYQYNLRIRKIKNQEEELNTEIENLELEEITVGDDESETEAGSECIGCRLDRMRESTKPSGMQIAGNVFSILAGIGLGNYAAQEGRRAQRQANEIRALQGFEAESTNYSLAGLGVAYPFISKGIYGLTHGNNSVLCSGGINPNGAAGAQFNAFGPHGAPNPYLGVGAQAQFGAHPFNGAIPGINGGLNGGANISFGGGAGGIIPGLGLNLNGGIHGGLFPGAIPGINGGLNGGANISFGGGAGGIIPGLGLNLNGGLHGGLFPGATPGINGGIHGGIPGISGGLHGGFPGAFTHVIPGGPIPWGPGGIHGGIPGAFGAGGALNNPAYQYQQQQLAQQQYQMQLARQQIEIQMKAQKAWLEQQQAIQKDWQNRQKVISGLTQEMYKIQQQINLVARSGTGNLSSSVGGGAVLGASSGAISTGIDIGINNAPEHSVAGENPGSSGGLPIR